MTRTKVKATATVKVHVHSPMSGKQRPYHVLSSTFCTTCRCALMSKKNMQCNSHHTACFQCDILHVYACSVHVKLMFSTPCRRILRCIAIYSTPCRRILRCIAIFYAVSSYSTPHQRTQRLIDLFFCIAATAEYRDHHFKTKRRKSRDTTTSSSSSSSSQRNKQTSLALAATTDRHRTSYC